MNQAVRVGRAVVAALLLAANAWAITPGDKCEAAKLKAAGKYAFCRMNAESKAIKKGEAPDYSTCDATYAAKWATVEAKAGGACPVTGDLGDIQTQAMSCTDGLTTSIGGGPPEDCAAAELCGNGVTDAGEDCDFGTLNGATCISEGFAGGALSCSSGCVFDTGSCVATRYTDNDDGTISDAQTGLMWEKQVDNGGGLHDKDNIYTWPDAMGEFLSLVNGYSSDASTQVGLGGHSDWRLPTIAELRGILFAPNPCGPDPCIDPTFGLTASDNYWSSTTNSNFGAVNAFAVFFGDGTVGFVQKGLALHVRAVRGGS